MTIPDNTTRCIGIIPMYRKKSTGKVLSLKDYEEILDRANPPNNVLLTLLKSFKWLGRGWYRNNGNVQSIASSNVYWKNYTNVGKDLTDPLVSSVNQLNLPGIITQIQYIDAGDLGLLGWMSNYGRSAVGNTREFNIEFTNVGNGKTENDKFTFNRKQKIMKDKET